MKILHIKGATIMMGLNQNEYLTVPLVQGMEYVTDANGNSATVQNITGAFKPTPEELDRLVAGASIHLTILGTQWPPMKLLVQEIPADPASPDDTEFNDPKVGNGDGMQSDLLPGQFVPQWRGEYVQIVDVCKPCELEQGDQVVTINGVHVQSLAHFMLTVETAMKEGHEFLHMEVFRGYGGPMRGMRMVPILLPLRVDVPTTDK